MTVRDDKTKHDRYLLAKGRYEVGKIIGRGGFGAIYTGFDRTTEEEVAIKFEEIVATGEDRGGAGGVEVESKIYALLKDEPGFAKVRWFGSIEKEGEGRKGRQRRFNVMVFDRLEVSLHQLFSTCGSTFGLKTVLMIADQLISRIETLHSVNFVHNDLNPSNIMVGPSGVLHLIDFGLSSQYRNPNTNQHIPFSSGARFTGTLEFSSLKVISGQSPSRRTDLFSIFLTLVYFLRGSLPWDSDVLFDKSVSLGEEKCIKEMGKWSNVDLTAYAPIEFLEFVQYIETLDFDGEPDYAYLRRLFKELFHRKGFKDDGIFDWMPQGTVKYRQSGGGLIKYMDDGRIDGDFNESVYTEARINTMLPWRLKSYPLLRSSPYLVAKLTGRMLRAKARKLSGCRPRGLSGWGGRMPRREEEEEDGAECTKKKTGSGRKGGGRVRVGVGHGKAQQESSRREQLFNDKFGEVSEGAHHAEYPVDLNMCDVDRIQELEWGQEKLRAQLGGMSTEIRERKRNHRHPGRRRERLFNDKSGKVSEGAHHTDYPVDLNNMRDSEQIQQLESEQEKLRAQLEGMSTEIRERKQNLEKRRVEGNTRFWQACVSARETCRVQQAAMDRSLELYNEAVARGDSAPPPDDGVDAGVAFDFAMMGSYQLDREFYHD